jgi:hypothetical protein
MPEVVQQLFKTESWGDCFVIGCIRNAAAIVCYDTRCINPLNPELNPVCHLLVLLGDLKFMGPCIVSIFQYISNKMQSYEAYLYLETAVHVLGGTSTHHQDRIQLYLQHLIFVTTLLLLSDAIVEELEPVRVCCGWRTPHTAHSNRCINTRKFIPRAGR